MGVVEFGEIQFDPASGMLSGPNATRRLEPKAADVLAVLFAHSGTVVSRERLLESCWQAGSGSDEALTQAISQIRRALEILEAPREMLTTYARRGYRLTLDAAPSPGRRERGLSIPLWIPVGLFLAACILILAVAPHWPRHVIRHALGLGPPHLQHPPVRN